MKILVEKFWTKNDKWIPHHEGIIHSRRYEKKDYINQNVISKEKRLTILFYDTDMEYVFFQSIYIYLY